MNNIEINENDLNVPIARLGDKGYVRNLILMKIAKDDDLQKVLEVYYDVSIRISPECTSYTICRQFSDSSSDIIEFIINDKDNFNKNECGLNYPIDQSDNITEIYLSIKEQVESFINKYKIFLGSYKLATSKMR